MKAVHLLYPDDSGCIYCKKINGLIKIIPFKTPCLACEKMMGTIQGEGCECAWNDFDFDGKTSVAVYDPLAEYDRVNSFKTIPKEKRLKVWEYRNRKAYLDHQNALAAEYAAPVSEEKDSPRRMELLAEVRRYCDEFQDYGLEPPVNFPYVSGEELERWLETWSEFEPCHEQEQGGF